MAVTPDEVRRIAELARLRLEPGEVDELAVQLSSILEHMEALGDAGSAPGGGASAGREQDAFGSASPGSLRPDEPGSDPLAAPPGVFAPEFRDGLFTLPRVGFHSGATPSPADGEDGRS